jgi:triosephosphate isomerase
MRKKIIAANWKMFKNPKESLDFLDAFLPMVQGHDRDDILIFPTATSLSTVIDKVAATKVRAGAQTMHWLNEGPFTGQTSPTMLTSIGCTHVLLGHSERRLYANESYEHVNLKLKAAVAHDIAPVLCLGEMLADRQTGYTKDTLLAQMGAALANLPAEKMETLVIAYEPVWAIGTGSSATPEVADQAHAMIREELNSRFGPVCAHQTRILYGGSVKPDNVSQILKMPNIDGALIGGASLDPESLAAMVHYTL